MAQISTTDEGDLLNKRHEDYLAERQSLIQAEHQSAHNYDKYLVTLSSGALAISLTFVIYVAPADPQCAWAICTGWGAFALSLTCILAALQMSQWAFSRQRDIFDRRYHQGLAKGKEQEASGDDGNVMAKLVVRLTLLSGIAFVAGVILLSTFCIANFPRRDIEMTKQTANPNQPCPTGVKDAPKPPPPPVERPAPTTKPSAPAKK